MPKRAHVCREKATNGRTAPPTGYHHASTVAVSSIHMSSRYARKAPALHVCIWFRHCIGSIVEEEQAMLPDPLRRKRADCTLLNPQKDTTHTSGHKRTQIDHPAPPMVPTGQQLTTYLLWNGPQYKQSARGPRGCSACCCCLDLEREGEIKRGPHQSGEVRRCPMSSSCWQTSVATNCNVTKSRTQYDSTRMIQP